VATSDNAEVDNATAALWHFDENLLSRVFDSTSNHNDGEINGACWAGGRFSGGLRFDNLGNVEVPNSDSLDISGTQLTLEAWVYPMSFAAGDENDWADAILAKGHDDQIGHYGLYIGGGTAPDGRDPQFKIRDNENNEVILRLGENYTMEANTWYYLAATYDGSYMRIYVNGNLEGEMAMSTPIGSNDGNLYLGMHPHPEPKYEYRFDGIIDEVRISNVARTGEEILARYENGATYAWDDWTGPYTDNSGENITSALKRYIRWKAVLSSADRGHSPILHHVTVSYLEVGGPRVNVNYTFPRFETLLSNLNPSMIVAGPQEHTKLGVVLSASEDLRRLDNRLENRKVTWSVFGQTYENHTYRNSENLDLPPEWENMENEELLGMAWVEVQAPQDVGVSTATVSFNGDLEYEPSENTFSVHVTVIKLVETTESVIDRKVNPLWSEPSVQDLLAESGLSLPKENTRIGVTVEPVGAWENVTDENVHIWVRDMMDNEYELQVTENENLGENLRFWATYNPTDDLPDNALGYFDVRVVVDGVGQSDNRLTASLFQVGDLDVVGSHDNYVQAGENQSLRGMAWGIGRWENLEFACALDNLKEGAFEIWTENVFYENNYEITPDDIFLRLPPGGDGEVVVLLLSENLEGSWTGSYRAVPFVLDNGYVDENIGTLEEDNFTFWVTATRSENVTLGSVFVYIDGKPHEMSWVSSEENVRWSGTVEENYSYTWHPYQEEGNKENIGDHTYYFTTTDGTDNFRLPDSGAFSGPSISSEDFWSQYAGFFLENVDIYDNYYFDSSGSQKEVYSVLFEMIVPENSEKNENKWDNNKDDNIWRAEFNMGKFGTNPELKVTYYGADNLPIGSFSFHPLVIQTPNWLTDMIKGVDVAYHTSDTDENYWEIHVSKYPLPSGILTAVSGVSGFNIWEGIGDGDYGVNIQGLSIGFTLRSTQYDEWVEVWQVDVGLKEVKFGKDWSLTPELDFEGGFWVLPDGREEIGDIELKVRFSGEMSRRFPIAWFTVGPVPVEISAKPFVSADLVIFLGPDSPIEVERVDGSIGGGLGIYGTVNVVMAEGGVYGEVSGRVYFEVAPDLVVDKVGLRGEFGVYVRFIFWTWEHELWSDEVWLWA